MKRPGFWTGVGTLFGAVRMLSSQPGLWRYASIPMTTLFALACLGVGVVTWVGVPEALEALLPDQSEHWYDRVGSAALATLLWLVGSALALLAAWLFTPVLCAPALEKLVRRVEDALGVPPFPELSFFASFYCGLRAQVTGLVVLLPVWLSLWVLGLVLPFLAPLLLAAKLLAVALGLAWNLLDYPLTLRGMPARERFVLMRRHWRPVAGFGVTFACLFWIPLAAVGLLPLGVVAATRLVWTLPDAPSGAPSSSLPRRVGPSASH